MIKNNPIVTYPYGMSKDIVDKNENVKRINVQ